MNFENILNETSSKDTSAILVKLEMLKTYIDRVETFVEKGKQSMVKEYMKEIDEKVTELKDALDIKEKKPTKKTTVARNINTYHDYPSSFSSFCGGGYGSFGSSC